MKKVGRVLVNASILSKQLNGVSVYTIEVLKKLINHFQTDKIDFTIYSYDVEHLEFIPQINVEYIRLPAILEKIFCKKRSLHRILWNWLVLKKIALGYDVVYSPSTHGFFAGTSQQVITIHDLICLNYPRQNKMQYFYFKYLVPKIIKKSKVIAISNFTRHEVLTKYNISDNQISTIYNGADHFYNRQSQQVNKSSEVFGFNLKTEKYFLTVGANYPHKNIMMLLEVANSLKGSGYKFVIVGCNGSYRVAVEKAIQEKLLTNIILMPYVSNDELSSLYEYSIANIYISLLEGFGFPPIEASFYKKISFVANTSCMPEIYGDSVIYVDPYNLMDILEKITLFINGDIDQEKYSSHLKKLKLMYEWRKTADSIFDLIINTLNEQN
ncbi:glycosyltransferase family 4 protein [Pedobacter aquae]|uniref:Glycosyltransferase family 4 protein n=1 Tax=Pedobacter aquae TaxID=2605747 RepID=A0A5C0VI76_9SPHI|nr:glycosyltransferase family 1 protein [Pedobacter aquae]QEK52206.1 glycosyltransferase family 4 protein [Pedobacter aquae]